jgi:hypothetical protein
MVKKIFIGLLVLFVAAVGILGWTYSGKKTLITPYPYYFNANASAALDSDLKSAESANILIVGDRMAGPLSNYTKEVSEELGKNFKIPPQIYNWSKPHEGLHRTLFKLKSLKKWPSVIVYLGASSELYEKTFSINDIGALQKNFQIYDDEKMISLIITFPWLSKILYKKMSYIELGPVKEYKNNLGGSDRMKEKEASFMLFQYELKEMIELVKDKKSSLVLITTPLNLEVPPKEVCSISTSQTVIEVQQEIEALIQQGNYKKAYSDSLALANETYSNAKSFYLLGKSSMSVGDLKLARESLNKATVFDCANWRGNAVFNSIIRSEAKKHQLHLVDFDLMMSSALSGEGLFLDEILPQNLFYQNMVTELKDILKTLLSMSSK